MSSICLSLLVLKTALSLFSNSYLRNQESHSKAGSAWFCKDFHLWFLKYYLFLYWKYFLLWVLKYFLLNHNLSQSHKVCLLDWEDTLWSNVVPSIFLGFNHFLVSRSVSECPLQIFVKWEAFKLSGDVFVLASFLAAIHDNRCISFVTEGD